VVGLDLVIVSRILEGQGKETLLLQVGLVDASKRTGDDRTASQEAGRQSSMLARGSRRSVLKAASRTPNINWLTKRMIASKTS